MGDGMMDDLTSMFYTVSEHEEGETTIEIQYDEDRGQDGLTGSAVDIFIGKESLTIKPQQLMELGALFIALAGVNGIDFKGAEHMLFGYDLKGKKAAQSVASEIYY